MTNQSGFNKWLETAQPTEYIIRIRYKYPHETVWTYSNEYFYYDPSGVWVWENDWNEGQTDVDYISWEKVEDAHCFNAWVEFGEVRYG